ncbi:MAG: prolyl oligopeptidase family serine peptidase [Fimbriimonas sp.]
MLTFRLSAAFAALTLGAFAAAQKKPLDHSVYDTWKSVQAPTLSRDGKWILYRIAPQEGDAVLEVKNIEGGKTIQLPRGANPQFTQDGRYVVATVVPTLAETKKARRDKAKPEDQPKNSLAIVNLESGQTTTLPRVTSYQLAEEDAGWVVYKPEPPKPEPAKPAAKPDETKKEEAKKEEPKKPSKKSDHKAGDAIVLRNLATGEDERIENVVTYRFSKNGKTLVYSLSTKDGAGDGVVWYDLPSKRKTSVVTGLGHYPRLLLDEKATTLAFLTDKDDYAAKKPGFAVYTFRPGAQAKLIATEGTAGLTKGHWVPESSVLRFSDSGKRLFVSTAPKPPEEKKDDTPDDEKVVVDVWHWQDAALQPQQILQANMERGRTYEAVAFLDENKVVSLETPDMENVSVAQKGDGDVALGVANKPYRILAAWDMAYRDYFLVNPRTGERKPLLTKTTVGLGLSPTGKYAFGYNDLTKEAVAIDTRTGQSVVVSKEIPFPIWDELNDVPSPADSYGVAGWTPNDERVLLYDRYDIWAVDPTAKTKPTCVTNGFGRNAQTTLRYVKTDPEADFVDPKTPMLLSALNTQTMDNGFYRDDVMGAGYPEKIMMAPKRFGAPTKAKGADRILFTRQDFIEYPDVWVADNLKFENPRKLTDANPQQKDYNWGKAELVTWTSNDGVPLQGILIKPENFDYAKKYPMITYFYERNAETLHQYRTPAPTASILNPVMAASNGYIVFIPDIPYKDGYPGESAVSAILPGVHSILSRGYVDPKRLAIDGQSWGGYQVAYLVTETNLFRCAYAGAPVTDMFAAYGGIRWGTGLVRQFQYERGQSRIGASPWEKPLRYLENSPQFFLDKVQTPLLIMANDKDGAVPWYQGIELFTGLRRLQKPSWLLVYNNEDHNLVERKNRKDLSIRKQQFFDHYLKDAPMPVWMKTGVPATEKGKTLGLEIEK